MPTPPMANHGNAECSDGTGGVVGPDLCRSVSGSSAVIVSAERSPSVEPRPGDGQLCHGPRCISERSE